MNRWKMYCEKLGLQLQSRKNAVLGSIAPKITREESEEATLKIKKAPRIENIPSELLKYGGCEVTEMMQNLCDMFCHDLKTGQHR